MEVRVRAVTALGACALGPDCGSGVYARAEGGDSEREKEGATREAHPWRVELHGDCGPTGASPDRGIPLVEGAESALNPAVRVGETSGSGVLSAQTPRH